MTGNRVSLIHTPYRRGAGGEDAIVYRDRRLYEQMGWEVSFADLNSPTPMDFVPLFLRSTLGASTHLPHSARICDAELRATAPRLVHTHNVWPTLGTQAWLAATRRNIPVLATLHNHRLFCIQGSHVRDDRPCFDCSDDPQQGVAHACYHNNRWASKALTTQRLQLLTAARDNDQITFITPTPHGRVELMLRGIPEERVRVVPNSTDEHPKTPREAPRYDIAFFGGTLEGKGASLLQKAVQLTHGHNLRVLVAGPGEFAKRRQSAQSADITFAGPLNQATYRAALRKARFVVLPSIASETFSLVVAEAMAAGTPVIVPRWRHFPWMVPEQLHQLMFTPGDANDLARCIEAASNMTHPTWNNASGLVERHWRKNFSHSAAKAALAEVVRETT